jgi:IS5 family transposase
MESLVDGTEAVDAGDAGGCRVPQHRKPTKRDVFLAEMDQVVPLGRVVRSDRAVLPEGARKGEGGRRPIGLECMLRIHFLQQWYDLPDPGVEEALYDSEAMRRFVGIDLGREGAPDETMGCKFRHLLERNKLADKLFAQVNLYLKALGMKLSRGTIVDATIIAASPSTKNKTKQRDPEMHQTKKGNQWHFGMKAHVGVDADSGLVQTEVFGDAGYIGAERRAAAPQRKWWIAEKRSAIKAIPDPRGANSPNSWNVKASIRTKVEHPFRVIKRQFGHTRNRYRLRRTTNRTEMMQKRPKDRCRQTKTAILDRVAVLHEQRVSNRAVDQMFHSHQAEAWAPS